MCAPGHRSAAGGRRPSAPPAGSALNRSAPIRGWWGTLDHRWVRALLAAGALALLGWAVSTRLGAASRPAGLALPGAVAAGALAAALARRATAGLLAVAAVVVSIAGLWFLEPWDRTRQLPQVSWFPAVSYGWRFPWMAWLFAFAIAWRAARPRRGIRGLAWKGLAVVSAVFLAIGVARDDMFIVHAPGPPAADAIRAPMMTATGVERVVWSRVVTVGSYARTTPTLVRSEWFLGSLAWGLNEEVDRQRAERGELSPGRRRLQAGLRSAGWRAWMGAVAGIAGLRLALVPLAALGALTAIAPARRLRWARPLVRWPIAALLWSVPVFNLPVSALFLVAGAADARAEGAAPALVSAGCALLAAIVESAGAAAESARPDA